MTSTRGSWKNLLVAQAAVFSKVSGTTLWAPPPFEQAEVSAGGEDFLEVDDRVADELVNEKSDFFSAVQTEEEAEETMVGGFNNLN